MSYRPPKKSETIEVRVPHELKDALMRKARAEGRSASEVIRSSIDTYLADRPKEMPMLTAWACCAAERRVISLNGDSSHPLQS
jgi:predicted transcriptional regulator